MIGAAWDAERAAVELDRKVSKTNSKAKQTGGASFMNGLLGTRCLNGTKTSPRRLSRRQRAMPYLR